MLGHSLLRSNPKLLVSGIVLVLTQFLITSIRLKVAYSILDIKVSLQALVLLGPLVTLVMVANITPGNLGVREWVVGLASGMISIEFYDGFLAAAIERIPLIVCTLIFGMLGFWYLATQKNLLGKEIWSWAQPTGHELSPSKSTE